MTVLSASSRRVEVILECDEGGHRVELAAYMHDDGDLSINLPVGWEIKSMHDGDTSTYLTLVKRTNRQEAKDETE